MCLPPVLMLTTMLMGQEHNEQVNISISFNHFGVINIIGVNPGAHTRIKVRSLRFFQFIRTYKLTGVIHKSKSEMNT